MYDSIYFCLVLHSIHAKTRCGLRKKYNILTDPTSLVPVFLKSRVSLPLNCTFLNFSYLQSQISIQLFWLLVFRITSGGGCSCPDSSLVPQLVVSIIIISWSRLQSPPHRFFSSGSSYLGPLLFHGGAPKRFQKPLVMFNLAPIRPKLHTSPCFIQFLSPKRRSQNLSCVFSILSFDQIFLLLFI